MEVVKEFIVKGYVDPKGANKVCKLQLSIYGLVQASRSWNKRFDSVIKDFGFLQSLWETCISKEVSGSTIEFFDDYMLLTYCWSEMM